jgi:hypothetical protein
LTLARQNVQSATCKRKKEEGRRKKEEGRRIYEPQLKTDSPIGVGILKRIALINLKTSQANMLYLAPDCQDRK